MRGSLLYSLATALSCLAAAAGGFFAGRAGGPNLTIAVRDGRLSGEHAGSAAGFSAGAHAGYRSGYSAGYRHAYGAAYRLAYQRELGQ